MYRTCMVYTIYMAAVLYDAWRATAWRHGCNEANGRKLIATCLTIHLNKGPFLAR